MIELRPLPVRRGMTERAIGGELCRDMIRVRCRLEIAHMAGAAVCRHRREVASDVALRALHRGMRAGKRKGRLAVIEYCALPLRCCMTERAVGGETGRCVIRIGCGVEVLQMTAIAVG